MSEQVTSKQRVLVGVQRRYVGLQRKRKLRRKGILVAWDPVKGKHYWYRELFQ